MRCPECEIYRKKIADLTDEVESCKKKEGKLLTEISELTDWLDSYKQSNKIALEHNLRLEQELLKLREFVKEIADNNFTMNSTHIEWIKQRAKQLAKEEMCGCTSKNPKCYSTGDIMCLDCGKPIKEVDDGGK
jgi:chromosome segregation ATPase